MLSLLKGSEERTRVVAKWWNPYLACLRPHIQDLHGKKNKNKWHKQFLVSCLIQRKYYCTSEEIQGARKSSLVRLCVIWILVGFYSLLVFLGWQLSVFTVPRLLLPGLYHAELCISAPMPMPLKEVLPCWRKNCLSVYLCACESMVLFVTEQMSINALAWYPWFLWL